MPLVDRSRVGAPRGSGRHGPSATGLVAAALAALVAGGACAVRPDARLGDVSVEGTRREWEIAPSGLAMCRGVTAEERPPPAFTTLDDAVVRWTFDGEATPFRLQLRNSETGAVTRPLPIGPGERRAYLSAADLAPLWEPRGPHRSHRVELRFEGPQGPQLFRVWANLAVSFVYECTPGGCAASTWLDERTPLGEDFEAICHVPRRGQPGLAAAERLRLHARGGRGEATLPDPASLDPVRAACSLLDQTGLEVRPEHLRAVEAPRYGIAPR